MYRTGVHLFTPKFSRISGPDANLGTFSEPTMIDKEDKLSCSRREWMKGLAALAACSAIERTTWAQPALSSAVGDRQLGWAVVGLGKLSQDEILPALQKTKSARLAALVSGHPDKAAGLAKQYSLDPKH